MAKHDSRAKPGRTKKAEDNAIESSESRDSSNSKDSRAAKREKQAIEAGAFPVIGIGASAGGLEALQGLFQNMPSEADVAIVVIQHLAPHYKSIMDSLLAKYTQMDVLTIEDGMKLEPNHVYLNPPDKDVNIDKGKLLLMTPSSTHAGRLPIDHFFRALAADQKEKAIGVVLSGTGSDGTQGIKAIKGEGGIAMVQSEEQARYQNMPRSAIDTGLVDLVLPVEKMGEQIMSYVQHPYVERPGRKEAPDKKQAALDKIFMLIRSHTGHDFSNYKSNTALRRIGRRMAVHQIDDINDYVDHLRRDKAEVDNLFRDMLIVVTNFFRDPQAFKVLEEKVLPDLVKRNAESSSYLRIWVPGCGTGEEAYSLAILCTEIMNKLGKQVDVQIFATDLYNDAVEIGRNGTYPENIEADVSKERLERFFIAEEGTYKMKKQIREMVVFARQNLIKDPPFSKLDLVSCRNVLIYMNSSLQKRIVPLFHYTLKKGGYLFLGSSESVGEFSNYFETVDSKWKIFQRKELQVPQKALQRPAMPSYEMVMGGIRDRRKPVELEDHRNVKRVAENEILAHYGPPCVLVNTRYEILYFHGNTDKYLTPPRGEPTFNLLEMARKGLRYKLNTLLHKASQQEHPITEKSVKFDERSTKVDITVKPVSGFDEDLLLVVFEEQHRVELEEQPQKPKDSEPGEESEDPRVAALEHELAGTKEYLQTTIEELETTNEELKSTNEELQSTNEELQSANEELETSREELQSTNEELETVNAAHQDKIEELSRSNNDLSNLLASTEVGTLFLDMDLNVARFTPAVKKIFNLIPSDVGRPVSDISAKTDYRSITEDARRVLDTLEHKEVEINTYENKWFLMRVLPYRTVENIIDGVVLTFVDITASKAAMQYLHRLATVVKDSNDAVTVQNLDGSIIAWNKGAEKMYGYSETEALKMNITETVPPEEKQQAELLLERIKNGEEVESAESIRQTKDGRKLRVWLTITALKDEWGNIDAVATTERDITELRGLREREQKK